eukprot:TRINITY_DN16806_c0_g1_i1.p1 TRINITY_DN16806_c0_g1~~TRINITY_DN16806_c0_g1_i1.p1  ORF type:complete len:468 (+),score=121.20 TRINITY_DN16806_c0_g1_i1:70-1473(+)
MVGERRTPGALHAEQPGASRSSLSSPGVTEDVRSPSLQPSAPVAAAEEAGSPTAVGTEELQRQRLIDNTGGSGSALGTYLNVLKNIIGSGMLAIPYALSLCGYVLGPALIVAVQLAAVGCLFLLMRSADAARQSGKDPSSYHALAAASAWGDRASTGIDVIILCYTFGTLTAYGVLIGDFLHSPLRVICGWDPPRALLLAVSAVVVLPLCCMQHVERLRPTSLVGNLALMYAAGVVFGSELLHDGVRHDLHPAKFSTGLLQACPILVFAYNFHYNMPMYYSELRQRSPQTMLRIVAAVYASVTVIYMVIGFGGYLRFGGDTKSNVINNYSDDTPSVVACRIGLGVMILCTYPIVEFPTRGAALRLAGREPLLRDRAAASAAVVLCSLGLSLAVPNIGVVVAYDAAVFGVLQHYILPGLFFLRLVGGAGQLPAPPWQRHAAWTAVVGGSVIGALGLAGTTLRVVNGDA